jgi:hypothetical protein
VKAQADEVATGTSMETAINAALVTLEAMAGRPKLLLVGSFACDAELLPLSSVDVEVIGVINVTSNTGTNGINFNNVTNAIWSGFELHRIGVPSTTDYRHGVATLIQGACDSTLELRNFKSYNDCTGTLSQATGLTVLDSSYPTINDFYVKGGGDDASGGLQNIGLYLSIAPSGLIPRISNGTALGGYGTWSSGVCLEEESSPVMDNVIGYGGAGYKCAGFYLDNSANGTLTGCVGYGSNYPTGSGHADGFFFSGANASILNGCTGYVGKKPSNASYSLYIEQQASPIINGGSFTPQKLNSVWYYSSANNGRFFPTAPIAQDMVCYSMQIYVAIANAGVTIKVGNAANSDQFATGVSLTTQGTSPAFQLTRQNTVTASDYLYATPSAAINADEVRIYYTLMYYSDQCSAIGLDTSGHPRITDSYFFGCSYSAGTMYLSAAMATYLNWQMTGCTIETYRDDALGINAASAITLCPIYLSRIRGTIWQITSFAAGTAAGTNIQN